MPAVPGPDQAAAAEFATRLNTLFDLVHPPDQPPYGNAEVVTALAAAGFRMSPSYLSHLRNGRRYRPRPAIVVALARFFKVEPHYFTDERYAALIDNDLRVLRALRSASLRALLIRSFDLSAPGRDMLLAAAEKFRRGEGLPPIPPGTDRGRVAPR